jgi:Xaa-Pro aminopeptidase
MKAAAGAIRPGATENSIAAAVCEAMIAAGSEFFSIDPHVRAGARSSMPHATYKRTAVKPGDSIVLEFGGVYQRYTAPLFRTGVIGRPPDRLKRLAEVSLGMLEVLYENIRPGRTMDDVARTTAKRLEGLEPDVGFNQNHAYAVGIGFPPDWVEHSVFIRPGSPHVLAPGMTFHTPRSFRVPGVLYVGFSETIVVTETGCEPLTRFPRELIVT